VRAAEEAETVLAEEAALMVEALADVALATTIATADADNSRQQTTINNRLGATINNMQSRVWRWQRQRWRRGCSGSIRGSGSASSGLALWQGEAADRTMAKVETATETVAVTTATEEAVAEAAAAQQQLRYHGGAVVAADLVAEATAATAVAAATEAAAATKGAGATEAAAGTMATEEAVAEAVAAQQQQRCHGGGGSGRRSSRGLGCLFLQESSGFLCFCSCGVFFTGNTIKK